MARSPILEYDAKKILSTYLKISYHGLHLDILKPLPKNPFPKAAKLVVKVDQLIGNRANQGLLKLNLTFDQAAAWAKHIHRKHQYRYFLIEPVIAHQTEYYLSLSRERSGLKLIFHSQGGTNIEGRLNDSIQITLPYPLHTASLPLSPLKTHLAQKDLILIKNIIRAFDQLDFAFLEINPISFNPPAIIDTVAELDSDAYFQQQSVWNLTTWPQPPGFYTTSYEQAVAKLNQQTPASLKLNVLNPSGQIWMLLSGGGASLVLADEVADLGWGQKLSNYGEYSGNPSTEDTYLYTQQILSLLINNLKKTNQKQALIIAGGVANFTDIYQTFKGIIAAIDQVKHSLSSPKVKIFVRRGGPNQQKGLASLKKFLKKAGIQHLVVNDDYPLTYPVKQATKWLSI
ncbi:MAG: hypothetical protein GXP43_03125 [bacterium]|nr:hypothetical protein [bacterium]